MTIFGVPWPELALEHVEGFLADAGGEGLTWEAKGTELPHANSIAKHVCGFANAVEGGFLLLGVERAADGAWSTSGLTFPGDDPPAWVASIARSLRPAPGVDVRDWEASGRRVAVVHVESVAEPPCMTRGGQVFERVSGQTVPVTDPAELARLFRRGELALERAAKDADEAAFDNLMGWGGVFRLGVGLAAVGYEPNVEARLFRSRTRDYMRRRFVERLQPDRYESFRGVRHEVGLRGLAAWAGREGPGTAWTVAMSRSGAVGVTATLRPDPEDAGYGIEILMEHVVRPAWDVASDLVGVLGGTGRTAAAVRTAGDLALIHRDGRGTLPPTVEIDEWTAEPLATGAELDRIRRQLLRSAGFEEWEPED